ncbi:MAG TPA: response regulator [Panacibacter sp.]|nr:response regulator [Panacibacter sp.]
MQDKTVDIVIMDDDADICLLMKNVLKFAGYTVQTCSTPDSLTKTVAEVHTKLIIMDMLLAGFDGREICASLKKRPLTSNIKIMMMSAHPDGEKSCLLAGADLFVEKPFDIDTLIAKVNQILK